MPLLKRDSTDKAAVRRLQGLLLANGHKMPKSMKDDGTFDGEFGDETEKALKAATGATIANGAQWKKLLGV